MSAAVIVKVREGKDFFKGVSSAKRLHGRFDAATQTWTIPAEMAGFIGLQNPGLIILGSSVPAAASTRCDCASGQMGGACECC